MKENLKKALPWAGMITGAIGIILLLKMVDGAAVVAAVAAANPVLLGLAALLVLLTVVIRAWRWAFLFRRRGINIPARRLLSILLIDSFYGQFLPASSAVGGAMLFTEGKRHGGSGLDVMVTVLVDRLSNLLSILAAASLLLLVAQPVGIPAALTILLPLLFAALTLVFLSLRWGWGIGAVGGLLVRLGFDRASQHALTLNQTLLQDLGRPWAMAVVFGLSLAVNGCMMMASYLVTLAVVGPVPVLPILAMAALIVALQGMPITPGALGIREGLYVFFLGLLGVGQPGALTVGLLVMMLYWLQGVGGGLVLLRRCLPEFQWSAARRRTGWTILLRRGRMLGGYHGSGA